MRKSKFKYNIGDMILIPYVEKTGIIIKRFINKVYGKREYEIYWTYKTGDCETAIVDETTLHLWFSTIEGKGKNNLNRYYPVIK